MFIVKATSTWGHNTNNDLYDHNIELMRSSDKL